METGLCCASDDELENVVEALTRRVRGLAETRTRTTRLTEVVRLAERALIEVEARLARVEDAATVRTGFIATSTAERTSPSRRALWRAATPLKTPAGMPEEPPTPAAADDESLGLSLASLQLLRQLERVPQDNP